MKEENNNLRNIYMKNDPIERRRQAERALPRLIGSVGAIAFALGLLIMAISDSTNIFILGLTGLGLLLVIIFFAIDFQNVKAALTSRTMVYSTNLLFIVAAFAGILIIINAFASNHYLELDLTKSKQNSLSDQTIQILNELKSSNREIQITAFLKRDDPQRLNLDILLERYNHVSSSVQYKFVDYEISKKLAIEKSIDRPTLLLETEGASKKVLDFDERSLTAGLLALLKPQQKVVALLTGHGELQSDTQSGRSISELVSNLEKENYIVKSINIATDGIPTETSIVLIPNPTKSLNEKEIQSILNFQQKGGAVGVFIEPFEETGLDVMFDKWGIRNPKDMIVDEKDNYFNDNTIPVVKNYGEHPITSKFLEKQQSGGGYAGGLVLPTATSIVLKKETPENVKVDPLAITSDKSWGDTSADDFSNNPETDIPGPLPIAMVGVKNFKASEESSVESRFIVVGDADFLTDASISEGSNYDFIMNSINWLAEDESLMEARPSLASVSQITLEPGQVKAIQFVNIFLPLLIAGLGLYAWFKRR